MSNEGDREALRDFQEDRLVREGKALCGGCDEAIHFNHDAGLWVDERDRHNCQGAINQHTPRSRSFQVGEAAQR